MAGKKKENEQEQTKTLEENFEQLDEYIKKMENEDISLEESFRLYTEGMKLIGRCGEMIDKVEKELIILEEK